MNEIGHPVEVVASGTFALVADPGRFRFRNKESTMTIAISILPQRLCTRRRVLAARGWARPSRVEHRRTARYRRMEPLEDRLLLSPTLYTVNSIADTGTGSGTAGALTLCHQPGQRQPQQRWQPDSVRPDGLRLAADDRPFVDPESLRDARAGDYQWPCGRGDRQRQQRRRGVLGQLRCESLALWPDHLGRQSHRRRRHLQQRWHAYKL